MAERRQAGVLVVVLAIAGACSEGGSASSWVDEARAPALELTADELDVELPATVGCEPLGLDAPTVVDVGPSDVRGTSDQGIGNDPYTATGARQVPGPDMVVLAPPGEPVSVLVARPVDPDEHVAARQADAQDTGPVPPPRYEPGRSSPARVQGGATPTPTTATDSDTPTPAPGEPCTPMLGP